MSAITLSSRPHTRLGRVCLWLAVMALAAPAHAQDAPDADDPSALARAREEFHEALALQAAGNWAKALQRFKHVARRRSTPQVRFNIGLCYEHLGRLVAALGSYQLAAADARVAQAEDVEGAATERAAQLKLRIPKIVVRRGAGAAAARIQLDGEQLGESALGVPIPVDPGPHTVNASADGFAPYTGAVHLGEGDVRTLLVELARAKPAAREQALPRATSGPTRWPGFLALGLGGAGLVTSGIFFALANSDQQTLADLGCDTETGVCRTSPTGATRQEFKDLIARRDQHATFGNVGLAVGIVGVGVGATLLLTAPKQSTSVALRLVAPNAWLGSSLVGRF